MPRFMVTVDSPHMAEPHSYELTCADADKAELEGAKQAIVDDRLGCGDPKAFGPGVPVERYILPLDYRRKQAKDDVKVEGVRRYALAVRR